MNWDWFTYERTSLILAGATVAFSVIAIVIALCSSRRATKEVNRLINDTNHATRTNIAVEHNKLDVEKYRLVMHMLELDAKKKRLQAYPNQNQEFLLEPPIKEQIKLIDEEYERCNRLHQKISVVQTDMSQAIKNF